MSLRQKTISGLIWTFSQQFGVQLINFLVSIALARLLMPSEFGLIGMISIFIAIGSSLIDSGLTSSLIRTINPDQRDYSTVFFINLAGSVVIYFILFLAAPLIANFYDQPILESIVRVFTFSFIINAFAGVQSARLTKEMNFKLQMTIQIPSIIVSGIIGVVLAVQGYGVWSLVYMNLSQSFLSTLQLWLRSGWRPSLILDKEKLKHHFKFGYKLTLSGLLDTIYNNAYNLIIGKYFSAAQLGYYTRAQSLKQLPVNNISRALNKVTYPLFASIQNDNLKLRAVYSKIMRQVIFWLAPTMAILFIFALPIFQILFGEKWLPAVPYFQILCFVGVLHPLHSYNLNILKVKGRSDLFLKLEIIKKIYTTIGIACAIPFGIIGLLWWQVISSIVGLIINAWYSGKLINYPLNEQLIDIVPIFSLSIVVGAIIYSFDYFFSSAILLSDIWRIMFFPILYFLFYLGLSYIIKIKSLADFTQLILKK
ncbi:lipopolysaccharide biosynthesis protein [Pontibacter sp. JH31]|uniref:Lipopolysaccharide biosynthesis protein n=1 Tax=Pontibacter aquaedesilientis TaxID=2766980 RepID=A0ABR7XF66_9BACT|nr:lipopolysaccharide biosynthesis protein [Pontibacter aquaedesilientis]MBD1396945.1 lipopolysaccharide biosynthesis protein [Pontibacter aquaedesilientis]